jgi:hypothetical protein
MLFAWRHRRREMMLPLAVVAAMLLVFAAGPIFGLPLIGRYVRTPAVLLSLFYGVAVCGFLLLGPGRERTRWTIVAGIAVAASLVYLPLRHVDMLQGLERRVDLDGALYGDLRDVGENDAVRAAFARCAPLSAADHRPIPYLRWWLDGDPKTVTTPEDGASPLGRMLLLPRRGAPLVRRFYRENLPRRGPPAGWQEVYGNRTWRVYAAPGCAG